MSSSDTTPRKFKIEGSGQMLEALSQAIELALRAARTTPDRTGAGSISRRPLTIEVEAKNAPDNLKYVIQASRTQSPPSQDGPKQNAATNANSQ